MRHAGKEGGVSCKPVSSFIKKAWTQALNTAVEKLNEARQKWCEDEAMFKASQQALKKATADTWRSVISEPTGTRNQETG